MQSPPLDPPISDTAPGADMLTGYDEQHLVTYLRLLDTEAEGADWQEVARIVLRIDPVQEPERAHRPGVDQDLVGWAGRWSRLEARWRRAGGPLTKRSVDAATKRDKRYTTSGKVCSRESASGSRRAARRRSSFGIGPSAAVARRPNAPSLSGDSAL